MEKSRDAFRTISEVSLWLDTPAHVLRFWESRFTQVKPVKRAGGRRYYRPSDMLLLGGIKKLLHEDGLTIRGVQKILREQGVKHVAALSQALDDDVIEASVAVPEAPMIDVTEPERTNAMIIPLSRQETPRAPLAEDTTPDAAETPEVNPGRAARKARRAKEAETSDNAPELPFPMIDEPAPAPDAPAETDDKTPAKAEDEAPPAPLGTDLPQGDPADEAITPSATLPLTSVLRDAAALRRLKSDHGAAVKAAVARLGALSTRMADGE